ncbi:MAG TPA: hypothetical protein VFE32_13055 [Puia sp.]|jgi:uncharacterized protein YndB with AHSA1/START domain|nr:hypothetical protein [Puia sp.]
MNNNWSEFKLRINTTAPIEKAYVALSTPGGLESWFLRRAELTSGGKSRQPGEQIQKGDEYSFQFHGYPDSKSHTGRWLGADGKSVVSFTFSQELPVTISLYRECDETIVELVEAFDPTDEGVARSHYLGNMKGWIFYLVNLKSVLEGGLDLRNRKVELQNVLTA